MHFVFFKPDNAGNVMYNLLLRSHKLQNNCRNRSTSMLDANTMKYICDNIARKVSNISFKYSGNFKKGNPQTFEKWAKLRNFCLIGKNLTFRISGLFRSLEQRIRFYTHFFETLAR